MSATTAEFLCALGAQVARLGVDDIIDITPTLRGVPVPQVQLWVQLQQSGIEALLRWARSLGETSPARATYRDDHTFQLSLPSVLPDGIEFRLIIVVGGAESHALVSRFGEGYCGEVPQPTLAECARTGVAHRG